MSMFNVRDSLSDSGFTNRVDSVFAALGSGSIKSPEDGSGERINRNETPSFDQDQYKRSIRPKERNAKQRKFDDDFKHPAEFLRPPSRDRSSEGGSRDERRSDGDRGSDTQRIGGWRGGARGRGTGGGRGRGGVPDFKKNPDKWTKYSLADVDNVTDRSNASAAFQFLKTIKSGKSDNEEETEAMDSTEKLVFKKPTKKKSQASTTKDIVDADDDKKDSEQEDNRETEKTAKAKFVGSKNVMPEYVVGAKPSDKEKKKKSKEKSKMEDKVKLSYLQDDEEDE